MNIDLNVVIDKFYRPKDSVRSRDSNSPIFIDYVGDCNPCYELRVSDSKFRIIGFKIIVETDEDIVEFNEKGSVLSLRALSNIRQGIKGQPVYFECIKAKHESGNIFILKSFSIIF